MLMHAFIVLLLFLECDDNKQLNCYVISEVIALFHIMIPGLFSSDLIKTELRVIFHNTLFAYMENE